MQIYDVSFYQNINILKIDSGLLQALSFSGPVKGVVHIVGVLFY